MGRHLRLVRHPEGASNHSAPLSGKQNPKSSASVRFKACERGLPVLTAPEVGCVLAPLCVDMGTSCCPIWFFTASRPTSHNSSSSCSVTRSEERRVGKEFSTR